MPTPQAVPFILWRPWTALAIPTPWSALYTPSLAIRPPSQSPTSSLNNWVVKLCVSLGANEKDLVPFEKYAAAAQGLANPSSAARALFGGAPNIERVDRLVRTVAAQKGMSSPVLDEVVALVDAQLEKNRKAKA